MASPCLYTDIITFLYISSLCWRAKGQCGLLAGERLSALRHQDFGIMKMHTGVRKAAYKKKMQDLEQLFLHLNSLTL